MDFSITHQLPDSIVSQNNARILVVDDNSKNIQVLANILTAQNYEVEYATNGEDALELTEESDFDLILLDIMMPGMNGFTVCKKLKQQSHTKDIPVIFLTAKTDTDSIVKGLEIGAVDYLTKPFNTAELLARVRTHLELKHSREKIQESEKSLRELNATKDKFFSIISHELKNPFAGLISLSEILMNIDVSDAQQIAKFSGMLNQLTHQVYELLENLLEWSRLQTGNLKTSIEECDLIKIIRHVTALYETTASNKNINLSFKAEDDSVAVMADETMLDTILRNLISNALKFTPENGKVIVRLSENETFINVCVEDNGVGIDKSNLSKLFRLDEHFTTKGTAKEKGTGLGLILCKELAEKNKGRLSVESEAGKGSKFTLSIPKPEFESADIDDRFMIK